MNINGRISRVDPMDKLSNRGWLRSVTKSAERGRVILPVLKCDDLSLKQVDEESTTAAAAVRLSMPIPVVAPPSPKRFDADHPFMFVLTKNRNPLFMGHFA
ncbi:hypothetical protein ANCDUO_13500 [Ancylostoma duodenale]|uniref:Serpin domain-containing protein n=1 Tax=Ancylostoma duodenale TaxID=51022 RepID=A0A0C2GGV4_9BILA|nr:hypothetical protein ANCDUO_13500 [Ancylostoma duodenale]